jgi:putative ABC transport system permease protein
MKTIYNKIRRDLWDHKGRTVLVVLSIAIGVMAVGMILSSNIIMTRQMALTTEAMSASHGRILLDGFVTYETIEALEKLPEVEAASGVLGFRIQWRPSSDAEWTYARLTAFPDYDHQKFDIVELIQGQWPSRNSIGVIQNQLVAYNIPEPGGQIYFKVNDQERAYPIGGVVRDPSALAPPMDDEPTFYISTDLYRSLTGFDLYSQIRITVPEYSEPAVEQAAARIERNLERLGVKVDFFESTDPTEHWAQDVMAGVGLILTIMAAASLGLSTFLVINMMSALMVQQIPQIGIMKIVGGLRSQIITLYLAGVTVYGVLALLIAVPLGALAGDALSGWMLNFLNILPADFKLVPSTLVVQMLTGLLTPLLAALYPVLQGGAIPPARAIADQGLGQGKYGTRFLDRLLGSARGIPRLTALSLRNTFRRPGRVLLTQITLTIAGTIFMMVLTTEQSFNFTIDKIFDGFGFDVMLIFEEPQRIDEILPMAESRPHIDFAEMWVFMSGYVHRVDEKIGKQYEVNLRGVPENSRLYTPLLAAGRPLMPEDGHAMLLNQKLAADMDLGVGDQVMLNLEGYEDTTWTIVGLILDLGTNAGQPPTLYVHQKTFNTDLNRVGLASVVEVQSKEKSVNAQLAIANDLTAYFESQGIGVAFTTTALKNKELANAQFSILTTVLLVMTVLIASVGSFGLSGTLSINVLERTREIGVMRAVGASSTDIARLFMGEGLLLGLMSWLLAIPLSIISGRAFVDALAEIIDFPFDYLYSTSSVGLWLGIVVVLSLLASWLPARRATKISVRESLAYE